jgi:nucleoside 2-deoxyribosyltransferase
MNIYIAGKFEDQAHLRVLAEALGMEDFFITSRWLRERNNATYGVGKPLKRLASRDLEDIDAADVLVVFAHAIGKDSGTVGRHVETGYALGKGIPVIYLGLPRHIFTTIHGTYRINLQLPYDMKRIAAQIAAKVERIYGA